MSNFLEEFSDQAFNFEWEPVRGRTFLVRSSDGDGVAANIDALKGLEKLLAEKRVFPVEESIRQNPDGSASIKFRIRDIIMAVGNDYHAIPVPHNEGVWAREGRWRTIGRARDEACAEFDTRQQCEEVKKDLVAGGVDKRHIEIYEFNDKWSVKLGVSSLTRNFSDILIIGQTNIKLGRPPEWMLDEQVGLSHHSGVEASRMPMRSLPEGSRDFDTKKPDDWTFGDGGEEHGGSSFEETKQHTWLKSGRKLVTRVGGAPSMRRDIARDIVDELEQIEGITVELEFPHQRMPKITVFPADVVIDEIPNLKIRDKKPGTKVDGAKRGTKKNVPERE